MFLCLGHLLAKLRVIVYLCTYQGMFINSNRAAYAMITIIVNQ